MLATYVLPPRAIRRSFSSVTSRMLMTPLSDSLAVAAADYLGAFANGAVLNIPYGAAIAAHIEKLRGPITLDAMAQEVAYDAADAVVQEYRGSYRKSARMRKPTSDERKALGAFLVSRRARLQPAAAGLPTSNRRTPGLRREEVAVLAGVSVSWYTWLEQGRDIRASGETLQRVSDVLELDQAETSYLFALSLREQPASATSSDISVGLTALVNAISPIPAYVRNPQLDILVWNKDVADLFVDYGTLKPHERNTLRLLFLHPSYRALILDWEHMARGMLATFRAARARARDKKPFDKLVTELCTSSGEFRDWWSDTNVTGFDEGNKRLRHPTKGLVNLTYIALVPEGRPDLSLVVYIPDAYDQTS